MYREDARIHHHPAVRPITDARPKPHNASPEHRNAAARESSAKASPARQTALCERQVHDAASDTDNSCAAFVAWAATVDRMAGVAG